MHGDPEDGVDGPEARRASLAALRPSSREESWFVMGAAAWALGANPDMDAIAELVATAQELDGPAADLTRALAVAAVGRACARPDAPTLHALRDALPYRALDEEGDDDGPDEVRVAHTVAVPPESVFAAWTDAEQWSRWFAPGTSLDARPGGRYETSGGDRGELLIVDPPHHLRFTWENPECAPGTLVDVTFAPTVDGGTHVEVAHTGLATKAERDAMAGRWGRTLQRL